MKKTPTVKSVMEYMGFPETEQGHYVTLLRQQVAKQISRGMTKRSGGSWTEEGYKLSYEEKAKHLLSWDWEIEHGHGYRTEIMDSVIEFKIDIKTMKKKYKIHWNRIIPKLGDYMRMILMKIRIFKDRKILRIRNPYE